MEAAFGHKGLFNAHDLTDFQSGKIIDRGAVKVTEMEVHFYATLRDIVGGKSVHFDLPPGMSARQLLLEITRKFPALQQKLINKNGDLHNYVHYFINGRDVRYLEAGMDTQLNPDDIVSVFPAVGGG